MNQPSLSISLDENLCIGNAMCRRVAPKTFIETDDGLSMVAQPPLDARQEIVRAAAACPVAAIVVRDPDTGEEIYE